MIVRVAFNEPSHSFEVNDLVLHHQSSLIAKRTQNVLGNGMSENKKSKIFLTRHYCIQEFLYDDRT